MTLRTRLPEHNLDVLRAIAELPVLVDHVMESLGNHGLSISRIPARPASCRVATRYGAHPGR